MSEGNRRRFLGGAAALLVGACGGTDATGSDGSTSGGVGGSGGTGTGGVGGTDGSGGDGGAGGSAGPPLECTPTADNLLGPYYRDGAPFRDDLTEPGMPGTRISIRGRVVGNGGDDGECVLLDGALLDFWQADDDGGYDNDGVDDPPPDAFVLRGKVTADAAGAFALRTIVPGHYLNGAQFRPAHVHVTVSAAGYAPLTTQLYFEGDAYNDIDPFIIESLIMATTAVGGGELEAVFDFVLEPL
jgi:protocatechuate 3,4-dioxygenase beta subunit